MKHEPNLFDAADSQAEKRAEADAAEGRMVSHEAVRRWLLSWGTNAPLPRPRVGD